MKYKLNMVGTIAEIVQSYGENCKSFEDVCDEITKIDETLVIKEVFLVADGVRVPIPNGLKMIKDGTSVDDFLQKEAKDEWLIERSKAVNTRIKEAAQIKCIKCGYERTPSDTAPDYECPECGVVYAKMLKANVFSSSEKARLSSEDKLRAIDERASFEKQKVLAATGYDSSEEIRLSDEERLAVIKEKALHEKQKVQAWTKNKSITAAGRRAAATRHTQTNQFIAIVGALVLIIGVFSPLVKIPVVGGMNFFNQGQGDGVIVLVIAILAIVFAITNNFRFHFYSGVIVFGDLGYVMYKFTSTMHGAREQMNADLVGNPFKGLADVAVSSVQLQWGWALLLIGACLLVTSAVYQDNNNQR